ncbi:MAG: glutamyl-tRNA synthetase [Candidatus Tokpelaia sp. JSC188]|nr:MAG: glutamyl-tRNA synthetase [Candidatus Tokpelaia sp. JSC188]
MSQSVITRFSPSPTGFLHIGGARTALFNWLYAKHTGGKMLLRIEDTDQKRSTEESVQAILNGLTWLELEWNGDPISQLSRINRHREIAEELVAADKAYYCYTSPEELAEMRKKAKYERKPPRYDGRWRDCSSTKVPTGIQPVIRIKSPRDGHKVLHDIVQGDIHFSNKDLDDYIILRSDATPTYMLAVVVDDHDMGVTHIIRGDDHLTNAARQTVIYDAMGWTVPVMAHIPLIHGLDGAKLSKRHGALSIEAYRNMGYLPIALRNYLVRLGWSHGNDEIMSMQKMIEWFDIIDINKGAARFDFKKLEAINGQYIRASDNKTLLKNVISILPEIEDGKKIAAQLNEKYWQQLRDALPELKKRAKTLVELIKGAEFIFAKRPISFDKKATAILNEKGRRILGGLLTILEDCHNWTEMELDNTMRTYSKEIGLKLSQIAQPLRAALTGCSASLGVFAVMTILGREESLARIREQVI